MNQQTSIGAADARGGLVQAPRERVLRAVRSWITEGLLRPDERLPAERILAAKLDVSRDTVRSALDVLEAERLIGRSSTGARVVGRGLTDVRSLSANTVAVVSTLESEFPTFPQQAPGWELWLGTGVTRAIYQAGLNTLLLHPDHLVAERLISEKLRGVIMLHQTAKAAAGAKAMAAFAAAGLPTVIYGESSGFPAHDTVYSDHSAGAFELTNWLIHRGCRRVLRVWHYADGTYPAWLQQRDQGYERAMQQNGLPILPPVLIQGGPDLWPDTPERFNLNVRFAAGFVVEYLTGQQPVDAIMAASDGPADFVTGACRLYGREPGRDILVTGYDNYWQESPSRPWEPVPPAATVDKMNLQMGLELGRLLLDRASGTLASEPQHRLVAPKLVLP